MGKSTGKLLGDLILQYTAISINVVGSKHKTTRQDRKVVWDFFMNELIKINYA